MKVNSKMISHLWKNILTGFALIILLPILIPVLVIIYAILNSNKGGGCFMDEAFANRQLGFMDEELSGKPTSFTHNMQSSYSEAAERKARVEKLAVRRRKINLADRGYIQ